MKVKQLAELAGTTVRTVRYYHQIGLLAVPSSHGSQREYDFTHAARLLRIRWLVDGGMPLSAIRDLLDAQTNDEPYDPTDDLTATLDAIDQRMCELTEHRIRLAAMLERARANQRISPLSPALLGMYDELLSQIDDPEVEAVIVGDRDVAELAALTGSLPTGVEQAIAGLGERDLRDTIRLMTSFAHLPQVPAEQASRALNDLVEETLNLIQRLGEQWRDMAVESWDDGIMLTGFVPERFSDARQLAYIDAVRQAMTNADGSAHDC